MILFTLKQVAYRSNVRHQVSSLRPLPEKSSVVAQSFCGIKGKLVKDLRLCSFTFCIPLFQPGISLTYTVKSFPPEGRRLK